MFDRRVNREGAIAGQVPEEWIQYAGFFESDNFLRIGVVDEFTDIAEPVYIDLVQPPGSPVRETAEHLLRAVRERRLGDGDLPPRVRAQLPGVGFPTDPDPALLVSTELPGWTTTGESRAQRYSPDRCSPLTPAPARATTNGSGLPVPQSATDTEGSRSESIIWTGTASVVADEARAARGREVFSLSAPPLHDVQIAVTSERLVYWTQLEGAPDWLDPEYGPAPGSLPFACGEVLHRYPGSVIEGESAGVGLPAGDCLTAPIVKLPTTVYRLHVRPDAVSGGQLASAWVRAIATWRLERWASEAGRKPTEWATLQSQNSSPTAESTSRGSIYKLPLACGFGADSLFR
jgi:hypothetical protein